MWRLIVRELQIGFGRSWVLYLANTLSIFVILLLLAYMDGSRRQLDLEKRVFSGEVTVKLKESPGIRFDDSLVEATIAGGVRGVTSVTEKVRTEVGYRLPGRVFGACEMVGVDFGREAELRSYLSMRTGRLPENEREVVVPSSFLEKADFKPGDPLRVMGKNSAGLNNSLLLRISGIYDSPGVDLFSTPVIVTSNRAVDEFYAPTQRSIEYCLSFGGGEVPADVNLEIQAALSAIGPSILDSAERIRASSADVGSMSVQFNVFLLVMLALAVSAIVTVVALVNYNVDTIVARKRRGDFGTLMAFGVRPTMIGLSFLLESLIQVLLSLAAAVALAALFSFFAYSRRAGGDLELLFVLLSGTNRIDFYLRPPQVLYAFLVVLAAVGAAQLRAQAGILRSTPIELLRRH
ncbi:MAG TPA: FtsX-like permease family protein [Rectinemataceae bacterium]|nr:FtsX-like permease family protein [Rectinemataceae bacterium]